MPRTIDFRLATFYVHEDGDDFYARVTFAAGSFVEARPAFERDRAIATNLGYVALMGGDERAAMVQMWREYNLLHLWLEEALGRACFGWALRFAAGMIRDEGALALAQREEAWVFDFTRILNGVLRIEDAYLCRELSGHDWPVVVEAAREFLVREGVREGQVLAA